LCPLQNRRRRSRRFFFRDDLLWWAILGGYDPWLLGLGLCSEGHGRSPRLLSRLRSASWHALSEEMGGEWRASKLEAFRGGDLGTSLGAMLALTTTIPIGCGLKRYLGRRSNQGMIRGFGGSRSRALGHMARDHGAIDAGSVAALKHLQADAELSGTVEDALGDIESFAAERHAM
jgi:hypothetical protein